MYTIATLTDFRRHLNLSDTDTDADHDLLRALQKASHFIESLTQRRYCPYIETRYHLAQSRHPARPLPPRRLARAAYHQRRRRSH